MNEDGVINVKAEDFIIRGRQAFLEALDFSRPELGPVREALDRSDIEAAGRAFMRHFRGRDMSSPLLPDWPRTPREPARVERETKGILEGHLWDGYNIYEVPSTGVDWHEAPLACLTRFDIFPALIQAAWDTGDPRYVRFVVDHGLDYIRAWPIESFIGQDTRKGWRNHYVVSPPWWWCMHPNRLQQWAHAVAFLRLNPHVTDEELLAILHRMLQEIRFHTFFFDRHVNSGENVGAFILEVMATLVVVMADFRESRRWMDMTAGGVVRFISQAFYPDGLYKELVSSYSASVSLEVQKPAAMILDHPTVEPLKDRLRAMLIALVAQTKPDGVLTSFGDFYSGALKHYIFEPLPDALGLGWLKPFLDKRGPTPPFLHWPERGQDAWGGYYSMRSDWSPDALFMQIDAGPWGKAHQHCDKLSFVLSAHGADFLTDPSTTTYANNEPGALITMLNAGFLHNTITVDDVDEFILRLGYLETAKPLSNRWENRDGLVLFEGDFDFAPYKAVRWIRRIVFVKNACWILQDVLTGEPEAVNVEQNFQFEPEITVELRGQDVRSRAGNGAVLLLQVLDSPLIPEIHLGDKTPHKTRSAYASGSNQHDFLIGRGWVGRRQRAPIPAPAVTYVGRVRLPAIFTMALIPLPPGVPEGAIPEIRREVSEGITRWHLPSYDGDRVLETSTERFQVAGDP